MQDSSSFSSSSRRLRRLNDEWEDESLYGRRTNSFLFGSLSSPKQFDENSVEKIFCADQIPTHPKRKRVYLSHCPLPPVKRMKKYHHDKLKRKREGSDHQQTRHVKRLNVKESLQHYGGGMKPPPPSRSPTPSQRQPSSTVHHPPHPPSSPPTSSQHHPSNFDMSKKHCAICGDTLISSDSQKFHINKTLNIGAQIIPLKRLNINMVLLCPSTQCCLTFTNTIDYHIHLTSAPHHSILKEDDVLIFHRPHSSQLKNIQCIHCYRSFLTTSALNNHYCRGEREYKCGFCVDIKGDYTNHVSLEELHRHIKLDHPESKIGGNINSGHWMKTGSWLGRQSKEVKRNRSKNFIPAQNCSRKPLEKCSIIQFTTILQNTTNRLGDVLSPDALQELKLKVIYISIIYLF